LIERLVPIQERILARAAGALDDHGTLVYATCTISSRENEAQIARLLARCPSLRADDLGASSPALADPADSRFLQTRPDRDGTDGFFIARLRGSERGPVGKGVT
jgi:16S rRNA (cytosine967-C5)-methyltransferase